MRAYFRAPRDLRARRLPLLPLGAARRATRTRRAAASTRASYFANVREVLDIVDEHTEPGRVPRPAVRALVPRQDAQPRRAGALQSGPRPPAWRSTWRCTSSPPSASRRASTRSCRSTCGSARACCAPATTRARGARRTSRTRLRARARAVARAAGRGRRSSSTSRRSSRRCASSATATASSGAPIGPTRRTALDAGSTVQLLLKQRANQEEYRVPAEVEVRLDGRAGRPGARRRRRRRPRRCRHRRGRRPAPAGLWEVHAMVIVAGFRAAGRVRRRRAGPST